MTTTATTNDADADAIASAAAAAPGTDAVVKRSPDTKELALLIMSHPFPTDTGRGPGGPNSNPYLVLSGTGLGGDRADLHVEFLQKVLNMNRVGMQQRKGPFYSMGASEQLDILSQKRDTILDALGPAGDEVVEAARNVLWGPSIPTASTTVTPRRRTRATAADADADGRTPKATNRQGGAEDHTTSFKVSRAYAASSALLSGTKQLLLDNLKGRSNANLRKVVNTIAALFDEVLPSAKALIGMKSGDIQIDRVLGEGSYGVVRHGILTTSFGKTLDVAVKEFKITEEQTIKIVEEEVRLLLVMGSFPYFPTVLDYTITPHFAAMVMDFMDGGILDDMDRQLSEEELKTYFRQLIACLMVMCVIELCHRDIKPENAGLKTDAVGNIVMQLLDFGLGRWRAERATTHAGTPGYMAPEVDAGNNVTTYDGIAADMWSTGVTALELAVSAEAFDEIKSSRRSDGSFNIPLLKRKIQEAGHSKESANLVAWMLTVDPTKRPSPLQAYEHAAFKGMKSLFESQLKDWAWVPIVLQDKKIKQQQAAAITSLEGRIVRIQSDHDAQLSEFAGRATAAEAALATAEAALAAAAAEEANENDPNAAAAAGDDVAAAAAAGNAGEDVDGANPDGFTAAEKAIVLNTYNTVSREYPDHTDIAKVLAVVDRLNGHVSFPCTYEQVREYLTQGDPDRAIPPQILTRAYIMTLGTGRGRTELKIIGQATCKKPEECHERLIENFQVYWT